MLRKIFVAATVVFFLFANTLFAQEKKSFEKGGVGYFQFPFVEGNDFVLWSNKQLTGEGLFDGRINKKTVIKIANRSLNLNLDNLFLLTGKRVFVYGKFSQIGEREGSWYYCEYLTIYILPDGESPGR